MAVGIQSLGGLTPLAPEERRPPRPPAELVTTAGVGQLVGLRVPTRTGREGRLSLYAPTLLSGGADTSEVLEPRVSRLTGVIESEALRIQIDERIEVHEEISVHRVRELASPVPGGEAARSPEAFPYVNLVRNLIEQEQIAAARRVLNAVPPTLLDDPRIGRLRKALSQPTIRASRRRDIDRSQGYQWIRDHRQEYRDRWVALDEGHLLACADSLRELLEKLKGLHLERPPLVHHIQ